MPLAITTFAHGGQNSAILPAISTSAFNAVAGNLIIVAVSVYNPNPAGIPGTISDTAGNNYILIGSAPLSPSGLDGTPNIWFYYSNAIVGNSANVVTWIFTAAQLGSSQIVAWQISGAPAGSGAISTFVIGSGATGSNAQFTRSVSISEPNSIVLAYGSLSGDHGATYTAGSGFTIDLANSDDGGRSGCEHQVFSSLQTGITPHINSSDSTSNWQMAAVVIVGTPSISGNTGAGGVNVSYSGTSGGTVIADDFGNYVIPGLTAGTYIVTPNSPFYNFIPVSRTENITTSSILGVNFTASSSQPSASGSGSITLLGQPLSGVMVNWTGPTSGQVTTDNAGNWTTGLTLFNGLYDIVPTLAGYTFAPPQIFASVARTILELNFRARPAIPSGTLPPPEMHYDYLGTPSVAQTSMNNPDNAVGSNATPTLNQGSVLSVVPPSAGRSGEIQGRFDSFNVINNPA